jgi:hypothetical protein
VITSFASFTLRFLLIHQSIFRLRNVISQIFHKNTDDLFKIRELCNRKRDAYVFDFNRYTATLSYEEDPTIRSNIPKKMKLKLASHGYPTEITSLNTLYIRWNLPHGFSITPSNTGMITLFNDYAEVEVEIISEDIKDYVYRCSIEIFLSGYPQVGHIPFVLLNGNYPHKPFKLRHVE